MWIARGVLSILLIAPYALMAMVLPSLEKPRHVLSVTIVAPVPTTGQLFYDAGYFIPK